MIISKYVKDNFPVNTLKDFFNVVLKYDPSDYEIWKSAVLSDIYAQSGIKITEKLNEEGKILIAGYYARKNEEMITFMEGYLDLLLGPECFPLYDEMNEHYKKCKELDSES